MTGSLDEFYAELEEEFELSIEDQRVFFDTPGDVIEYVAGETSAADGMSDEEHRDHVAAIVGELMARTLGITRYSEESRFEDMKTR